MFEKFSHIRRIGVFGVAIQMGMNQNSDFGFSIPLAGKQEIPQGFWILLSFLQAKLNRIVNSQPEMPGLCLKVNALFHEAFRLSTWQTGK
jgi:hypothetical protein